MGRGMMLFCIDTGEIFVADGRGVWVCKTGLDTGLQSYKMTKFDCIWV